MDSVNYTLLKSGAYELRSFEEYQETTYLKCHPQALDMRVLDTGNGLSVMIYLKNSTDDHAKDKILRIDGSNIGYFSQSAIFNVDPKKKGFNPDNINLLGNPDIHRSMKVGLPTREQLEPLDGFDGVFIGMYDNGQGDIFFFRDNLAIGYIQLHGLISRTANTDFVRVYDNFGYNKIYGCLQDPLGLQETTETNPTTVEPNDSEDEDVTDDEDDVEQTDINGNTVYVDKNFVW